MKIYRTTQESHVTSDSFGDLGTLKSVVISWVRRDALKNYNKVVKDGPYDSFLNFPN